MPADVSKVEDMLRRAFADAAASAPDSELRQHLPDPLSDGSKTAARRRGRFMIPIAAAAAVLAVVTAAIVVPQALRSGSAGTASTNSAPSGPTVYVATREGSVVLVDVASGKVIGRRIALPGHGIPENAELSPDGRTLCVLADSGGRREFLTCIDTRTGKAARPIPVPLATSAMTFMPDGRSVYLLESNGADTGGVVPVNLVTGTVHSLIRVPGAYEVVIAPDGRRAYVSASTGNAGAARSGQEVVPIDTATNRTLAPVKLAAPGYAYQLVISADGKTVYVGTIWGRGNQAAVTPVLTATDTALKPIAVAQGASAQLSLVLGPDGRTLYAYGTQRTVSPIDLATARALKPITLPVRSDVVFGFEIPPGASTGYFTAFDGRTVGRVDLATDELITPMTVLPRPYELGLAGIAGYGGYLYACGSSGKAKISHGKVLLGNVHGVLSQVQPSTGRIRITKVGGLPAFVVVVA
jgi:hypothetical protein